MTFLLPFQNSFVLFPSITFLMHILYSSLFLFLMPHGAAQRVKEHPLQFDTNYGGMHSMLNRYAIRFGTFYKKPEDNHCLFLDKYPKLGCFDVMLSTIHARTFLLDAREQCEEPIENKNNSRTFTFCKNHPRRFDPDHSLSKSGSPIPIVINEDGKEIGNRVQEFFKIDEDLEQEGQTIEIMNSNAATLSDYWGSEENLADGCLSLMGGELKEHSHDDWNAKPIQNLIDHGRMDPIITIHLTEPSSAEFQYDHIWRHGEPINGWIKFGALSFDIACDGWHWHEQNFSTIKKKAYWFFTINSIEGIIVKNGGEGTKQNAIIDTTTEQIQIPWAHWDAVNNFLFRKMQQVSLPTTTANDGQGSNLINCDKLKKYLPAFRFSANNLWYTVPNLALIKKIDANNNCRILIGKNADKNDLRWHLGVPFLRSHCVAKHFSMFGKLWLSGGSNIQPTDLVGENNGAAIKARSKFIVFFIIFIYLLFFI